MIQANYYPPNGYPYEVCADFRGESTDTKPSDVSEGSTFHEWDTGNEYMFDGEEWLLQTSGGGGGGFGAIAVLGAADNTSTGDGAPIPFYINEITGVLKAEGLLGEGANILVSDGVTSLASGAEISISWANSESYPTTDSLILYDLDLDTQEITPLPDSVTPILEPNITGCTFTMPAAADGHFIMLSVEESSE